MRAFLLALLIILCPPVAAAEIVGEFEGGTIVTLTDAPCTNAVVLSMLRLDKRELMHAGRVWHKGRNIALCWIVTPDGTQVVLIDEERDITPVGIENFARHAEPSM